jgi:hypothetical protein
METFDMVQSGLLRQSATVARKKPNGFTSCRFIHKTMAEKHCLIPEPLHTRDIPPLPLPFEEAGKGFAGCVDLRERVKLQASRLTDSPVLAGKGKPAKQVRPDFKPVKPRLPLRRQQFHQLGNLGVWVHLRYPVRPDVILAELGRRWVVAAADWSGTETDIAR